MKTIKHELVYPGATVGQIEDLVTDKAFREAVADYQRVVRRTVEVEDTSYGRQVTLDYAHGTERVPSFARRMVGDEIPIMQREDWDYEGEAVIAVQIPGKPGTMSGSATIAKRGDDVVETIELTIKVNIPLVGGKIEDLIADLMVKAFTAENKVGLRWLAGDWEPRA